MPTRRRSKAQAPGTRRKQPDGLSFRLDPDVRARAYRLHIAVEPQIGTNYSGHVEIECELAKRVPGGTGFELHAADLNVLTARIDNEAQQELADIEPRPHRETVLLQSALDWPKGKVTLRLEFSGHLRGDLRGFYAAASGDRRYAFTQLEAADARRFFPCFDEPAHKARFTVSTTTAITNQVISNSPIARTEQLDDGRQTVHFEPTPLLSSYLVALAVGELVASEPVYADGVPIRVIHAPGAETLTGFALEAARESLLRLAHYFALPYPYEKLDLVAVPDFEIGAMENAGAVFFRETLLLLDESSVSLAEQKRAAEVICHELAHMWYGNLVTMQWWDDLWLNEAFATWMAFDIVAKWRPEWKMWNDFGHSRDSALQLDSLANTHAIYTEVRTPAEASENFDLITYEKGAAVVRMLERYLGPSTFQRGVRRYIKRHREGNTVARDLWRALSEAAGQNVEAVVRPFIEQPGFPLLRVNVTRARGQTSVQLEQERFDARGPRLSKHHDVWPIPWVGRVARGKSLQSARQLLRRPKARVPLGSKPVDFVYGNADEGGFWRPLHDARNLAELQQQLPRLAASERLGFIHHQWALVRAGYAAVDSFVPFIAALADEPDADVLRALWGPAECLVEDIARRIGGQARSQLQSHLVDVFSPAWLALDWGDGTSLNEPNERRLLRAELLSLLAVVAESEDTVSQAEAHCERYLVDRSAVDPNLVGPMLIVGARLSDARRFALLLSASESDPTPQARRRFRMVLADVRDPALVDEVLATCLTPRIPTQDVVFVLARLLRNPDARARTFDFIRERWDELRVRIPSMLVSRLVDAMPALGDDQARKQVMDFFKAHPVPTAARALRQADERFRLDAAFRKRATPVLRKWLSKLADSQL